MLLCFCGTGSPVSVPPISSSANDPFVSHSRTPASSSDAPAQSAPLAPSLKHDGTTARLALLTRSRPHAHLHTFAPRPGRPPPRPVHEQRPHLQKNHNHRPKPTAYDPPHAKNKSAHSRDDPTHPTGPRSAEPPTRGGGAGPSVSQHGSAVPVLPRTWTGRPVEGIDYPASSITVQRAHSHSFLPAQTAKLVFGVGTWGYERVVGLELSNDALEL